MKERGIIHPLLEWANYNLTLVRCKFFADYFVHIAQHLCVGGVWYWISGPYTARRNRKFAQNHRCKPLFSAVWVRNMHSGPVQTSWN